MTLYALVENGTTIIPPILNTLPNWLMLPDGTLASGLSVGNVTPDGVYCIMPAQYDTPPANSVEVPNSEHAFSIKNGVVAITRQWQPNAPQLPYQITRKQGLRALLEDGGISDPEGAINAAIAAIQDQNEQKIMRWSFQADNWLVSDLITYAPMLGMSADQVTALAIKAATY